VDEGRRQVPLSTFYSASQGQDDIEGSERRPRRARRPPPEPTDGARGTEEDDDEGGCEGQPTEIEDDASGMGSSREAARAAKVLSVRNVAPTLVISAKVYPSMVDAKQLETQDLSWFRPRGRTSSSGVLGALYCSAPGCL
jgi:hypothetical protein